MGFEKSSLTPSVLEEKGNNDDHDNNKNDGDLTAEFSLADWAFVCRALSSPPDKKSLKFQLREGKILLSLNSVDTLFDGFCPPSKSEVESKSDEAESKSDEVESKPDEVDCTIAKSILVEGVCRMLEKEIGPGKENTQSESQPEGLWKKIETCYDRFVTSRLMQGVATPYYGASVTVDGSMSVFFVIFGMFEIIGSLGFSLILKGIIYWLTSLVQYKNYYDNDAGILRVGLGVSTKLEKNKKYDADNRQIRGTEKFLDKIYENRENSKIGPLKPIARKFYFDLKTKTVYEDDYKDPDAFKWCAATVGGFVITLAASVASWKFFLLIMVSVPFFSPVYAFILPTAGILGVAYVAMSVVNYMVSRSRRVIRMLSPDYAQFTQNKEKMDILELKNRADYKIFSEKGSSLPTSELVRGDEEPSEARDLQAQQQPALTAAVEQAVSPDAPASAGLGDEKRDFQVFPILPSAPALAAGHTDCSPQKEPSFRPPSRKVSPSRAVKRNYSDTDLPGLAGSSSLFQPSKNNEESPYGENLRVSPGYQPG